MAEKVRVQDTPADKWAAATKTKVEKVLTFHCPPCPHCLAEKFAYHCTCKACAWIKCSACGSILQPEDWSHMHENYLDKTKSHGRKQLRCV